MHPAKQVVVALLFASLATPAFAQMAGMSAPEKQAPPAKLFSGMGALHHPIATKNPEAQKFFDQGLTLVYAFNHAEAARSFQRAADLDPREPMPHWGIALALGPNYNADQVDAGAEKAAFDEIQKAKSLEASAPDAERAYIDALAHRFSTDPKADYHALARDYANAMREVSHRYIDDPDAGTLFAESMMDLNPWQLWSTDGAPAPGTEEIVATLESVLRIAPNHVGANHFYIHALEASPFAERALPSAQRLETLVPNAGHLVHMPAHIYIRTGDYDAAAKSNVTAVEVDRRYLRDRQITNPAYAVGYASHNLHFLAAAAAMDGDFSQAVSAAKELESKSRAAVSEMSGAEAFLPTPIFVLLRFAHWDEVLALPAPDAKLAGLNFFWHYARGCAYAAKNQTSQSEAELAALEQISKQLPSGPAFEMLYSDWATIHDLAAHSLSARIEYARGNSAAAIEHWRAAVAVQDKMRYNEPADWYYPIRESLGAALLRSGDAPGAEKVFREDLAHNPRNPRSLFGLSKSLEAEKSPDAEWVKSSFDAAWKGKPGELRLENF
jgi:Flp pilus assembly protein TadD